MRLALVAIAIFGWGATAGAADWPQWGGTPARNMVSSETGLPDAFEPGRRDPETGKLDADSARDLLWVARLGTQTFSSPAIANGRVLVGSADADNQPRAVAMGHKYNGLLYCFDAATGRTLWRLIVPCRKELPDSDDFDIGVAATPSIDGNRAYVVTNRCEVLCLDMKGLADGNEGPFKDEANAQDSKHNFTAHDADVDTADIVWSYDMATELRVRPHIATNSSPLVMGDVLYVATCNGADEGNVNVGARLAPSLIALDKRTGALLAVDDERIGTRLNHGQYSSPSRARVNGVDLILYGGGDGYCYAFKALTEMPAHRPATFEKVWWFDCNPREYRIDKHGKEIRYDSGVGASEIIGTPVCIDNRVYIAVGQDWTHGGKNGCLSCIDATKKGDVSDSGKVWANAGVARSISTAAVADGLVYLADQFGMLYCLDAASGETLWTHRVKWNVSGSALVADGKVYIGSRDTREFVVLAAGREKKVLNTTKFPSVIHSTPVAAAGTLFIATNTHLFAFRKQ